jgi:catechol 2,3-dioxygenase-like lactoylglutathione lyase family enzyme
MPRLAIFAVGIFIGAAMATGVAQGPQGNQDAVVGINHVAIVVEDMDEAIAFYRDQMGFPEAFRMTNEQGQPTLVYMQVSRGTFVELNPVTPQRQPGFRHFGLETSNIDMTAAGLMERGVDVSSPNLSRTNSMLANLTTPNGIQIEIVDPRPGSLHREAMESWE